MSLKWWKVLFFDKFTGEKLLCFLPMLWLDAVVLTALRRTRTFSRNIGKIRFFPNEVVKKESLSSFHVYRSNWEISTQVEPSESSCTFILLISRAFHVFLHATSFCVHWTLKPWLLGVDMRHFNLYCSLQAKWCSYSGVLLRWYSFGSIHLSCGSRCVPRRDTGAVGCLKNFKIAWTLFKKIIRERE